MKWDEIFKDDKLRMYIRNELEQSGCAVINYTDYGMQVAIKRNSLCWVMLKAKDLGGNLRKEVYNFPLGTDNPADEFRHDGNYPNSNGFWLYGTVEFRG